MLKFLVLPLKPNELIIIFTFLNYDFESCESTFHLNY